MNINNKNFGFTLVETLTATAIASVVITAALSVIGSIYLNQRRIQLSHDFYAESRYMMERISQIARNNTIDYDRYFQEFGPDVASCPEFLQEQVEGLSSIANNLSKRRALQYSSLFYWDTDGDSKGEQDRNLGGMKYDASASIFGDTEDPCVKAWSSQSLETLYFINASRTLRTAIKLNSTDNTIEVQRQIGADIEEDGIVDVWGPSDVNQNGILDGDDTRIYWHSGSSTCRIDFDKNNDNAVVKNSEYLLTFGNSNDQDICEQAHDYTKISPVALKINSLNFQPTPNQDPFLSFRIDSAQVHPSVFIALNIQMRNPNRYGFEAASVPKLDFQTTVSSRVFGNIRK